MQINGTPVPVRDGQTVLDVARVAGIEIPTLCWHPALSATGSCRLCVVDVAGRSDPAASCTLLAAPGMDVRTESPGLSEMRRFVLEMLLAGTQGTENAPGRKGEFERWVSAYGARRPERSVARFAVDADPNPFLKVDLNKCILCTCCVRACAEVQGRHVWGVAGRGDEAQIAAGIGTTMQEARCESCGLCAEVCPTGALEDRASVGRDVADARVSTTCVYCGVGCGLDLEVRDGRVVRGVSNAAAPVNGISLCVKGRYGWEFLNHEERLKRPRVRKYLLEGTPKPKGRGPWVETDWDTALSVAARGITDLARVHGPDSVAVFASAKCTNEENYLMQKFARQVVGTHNIDHCARLCHSSTVAGLAMCYGSGAMSNTMADVAEKSAALFVIGSNTTEQHPVFGARLRQAVAERGVPLVVADPRRIDLAEFAALHLRQAPGTDVALINGLMRIALDRGWHDAEFVEQRCEGFEQWVESLAPYDSASVARITGVPEADLVRAAEILATNRPMAVIWAMGITQHTTGVLNVLALGNLQMLLGNMGVPGGGVNPLRGQNNVQGACDTGALPNLFPGYQAVTEARVREAFAAAWRTEPPLAFGERPGLALTEALPDAGRGTVKGLYILGENPALTDPDLNHVRHCLERCEFTVLQEIFPSETSVFADVLLPGAASAEKEGTFTNTERRVQRVRRAVEPPGQARPDWAVTSELARRVLALQGRRPTGPHAGWEYRDAAQVLEECAALTPQYRGVSHARLDRGDDLYWPVPAADHPGTPILHIGTFTRGRGKFHVTDYLPPQERPDADFPFLLTTGRVLFHWHGGELTRRCPSLLAACPESLVEISPEDALRLGLEDGSPVRLRSRRGTMDARVAVTARVAAGVIFADFHFPGIHNANNLTIGALDPIAKIPAFKVCAVAVEGAAQVQGA